MSTARPSNADRSARPAVEVRADGVLLRRVAPGAAKELVARGWAEWVGRGRRRYVRLTGSAPLSSLASGLVGDGTHPLRADQTCKIYDPGQLMGDPSKLREFRRVK